MRAQADSRWRLARPFRRVVRRRPPWLLPLACDLAAITAFWLLFFWQIIVTRDHLIPFDLIDQHYMFQAFIHDALVSGEAPWWSPSILSGYPIAADPLSALFYPPNLAMHLLTPAADLPYVRLEFQVALHYLWAAIGTYLLARHLTGSRAGALVAALTFAFGSFFTWHLPHLSPISALSWLPWILLAYDRALRSRDPRWIALAAAAFGMMALTGHALTILQIGYLIVGLTVLAVYQCWRDDRREARRIAISGFVVLALGAGVAMAQLLPAWELSGQTERATFTFDDATGSSYQPHWLVTAVVPNFFSADDPAAYWGSGDIAETNLYAGLLPLVLAAFGLVRARADDRRMTALVLGGGLLALLLAMGAHTWLYRVAFDILPGVDRVRRPLNFIAFVQFALGLLAAYGVKALEADGDGMVQAWRQFHGWLQRLLVGILGIVLLALLALGLSFGSTAQPAVTTIVDGIVVATVIVLLGWIVLRGVLAGLLAHRTALALLVLIVAVDLGTAHAGIVYQQHATPPNSYIGPDWAGNPADPAVRFLQAMRDDVGLDRQRIYPNRAGSIWDNGPFVWDLESAYGYSVLWLTEYRQLHDVATADPGKPLIDLLNIRFLVLGDAIESVYPQASLGDYQLVHESSVRIYENRTVRPRAWVAHEAVEVPEQETLAWMQANGDALDEVVVINEPLLGRSAGEIAQAGTAEIVSYDNTRVVIRATMPEAGWLVLGDTYYPGWNATIDGEATEVARADLVYRAVWVPTGDHEVVFTFASSTIRTGMTISAGAVILVVGLLALGTARRHRSRRRAVGASYAEVR